MKAQSLAANKQKNEIQRYPAADKTVLQSSIKIQYYVKRYIKKLVKEQHTVQLIYTEVNFKVKIKTICIAFKEPLLEKFLLLFQHMMTLQTHPHKTINICCRSYWTISY